MRTVIAIAIFVMSWQPILAGEVWTALGVGMGSDGLAGCASGSLQVGRHGLISMRWVGTSELNAVNKGDGFFGGENFYPGAYDYGILLGWVAINDRERSSVSASVGIGQATITEKGRWVDNWIFPDHWDKVERSATAILLQGQWFVKKFGLQVFADFNSVRSFGGMVVSLRFLH